MADLIQIRRGTDAEWTTNNTEVLSDGELAIVRYANRTILIIGNGVLTVTDLIFSSNIFQIPLFETNSYISSRSETSTNINHNINFGILEQINNSYIESSIYSFNEIIDDSLGDYTINSTLGIFNYIEDGTDSYGTDIVGRINHADEGLIDLSIRLEIYNTNNNTKLQIDNANGISVDDGLHEKGIFEFADYSANKTEYSYITPAWLRYQTGYNAAASQMLTHNTSGVFTWVDL